MSRVLITGAGGYLGRRVVQALAGSAEVIASDLRLPAEPLPGVEYIELDICTADIAAALAGVDTVVHLAAIVTM